MRASRLLSILVLLELRGRVTAPALAREFEVSVRTIHRDIDELSAAGIPVQAERGAAGGYRLREGFGTRLNGLLSDEARALPLLGLPGRAAGELGLGGAPQRAQHKLLAALPREAAGLAGQLRACLHVDPADWYHEPEPVPHLPALARAMLDGQRVAVDYESWKGRRQWVIDPLGLVLKSGVWYAVVRQGARRFTLKVAALVGLAVLEQRFERPAGFDLPAWWAGSLQRFERELRPLAATLAATDEGCRKLAELGAYAAKAVAAARAAGSTEALRPRSGRLRVELPVESPLQAARLVLSLAPEVELLGPAAMRDEVAALARAMASRHRKRAAA